MKLVIVLCVFCGTSAFASEWNLPKRCQKTEDTQMLHSAAAEVNAQVVSDIEKFAADQNQRINETYKEYKFIGFPMENVISENGSEEIFLLTPNGCKFITEPKLIAHVKCHYSDSSCELLHEVISRDTYTSSRGYKWGTKPAPKSMFKKIFEVGRENTTEEAYSCRFSKEGMPTQLVGCSAQMDYNRDQFAGGSLKLYTVNTDLRCDLGNVTMVYEERDGVQLVTSHHDTFSKAEKEELANSALVKYEAYMCSSNEGPVDCSMFTINPNKISHCLMWKLLETFPNYNPYTDYIWSAESYTVKVAYKSLHVLSKEYSGIIPFTKEDGNAAYQYVCAFTPHEIPDQKSRRQKEENSFNAILFLCGAILILLLIILKLCCLLRNKSSTHKKLYLGMLGFK